MISKNYKNIEELKSFILNKIENSKEIDKKYKFYNRIRNFIPFLLGSSFFASVIYFIYNCIFLNKMNSILLLTPLINMLWVVILISIYEYLNKKIVNINIELNHSDFEKLSFLLSPEEMDVFMTEIDTKNSLDNWKQFLTPLKQELVIKSSEEDNINIRQINRSKYINSLYERR